VLGKELGEGRGLEPTVGRAKKLGRLKREKKLRKLKELELVVGRGAATMALLVSMGVNLISLGLTG
jgi:hypothetical protein